MAGYRNAIFWSTTYSIQNAMNTQGRSSEVNGERGTPQQAVICSLQKKAFKKQVHDSEMLVAGATP